MSSTLVAVYEQACSDAAVLPNSALARCFAATEQAMLLQVLSLSTNLIGPRGLVALLPVLRECRHTLHTLDLSHNSLDNATIRQLVLCFASGGFSALRRLELRGNLLTYQGGKCLVHWCEGLRTVRQAHDTRQAGVDDVKGRSAHSLAPAAPPGAPASLLCCAEYWCDATDVNIDYVGIEDTAMPEMLQRALLQRITDAMARREARRLGHSSQRRSLSCVATRESGPVADTSGAADSPRLSSADAESVKAPVLDGPPIVGTAHPFARSPADFFTDDNDELQHSDVMKVAAAVGAAAVAVTEARETDVPRFLQDDIDMDVLHKPAYDYTSAGDNVSGGAEELEDVRDDSGYHSDNSPAAGVAGTLLSADAYADQRSFGMHRRSGSVAEALPFPNHSLKEGSGTDARCAVSCSRPASSPPMSPTASDGFASYTAEPSAAAAAQQQQQEEVEPYPPPPLKTASNILDELGLEAVAETAGGGSGGGDGGGMEEDADTVPMWLEAL
ncbi:conserved hypothetical protein [Leishmania major strain Friedlin]|uniref:Leucine-rich repeat protein n=1 Tax=Leishmania major TaxID=5664 RepID=Q4QC70_LEIMA|nr:conserved hypothetical protein [Leishmania major strain Friedlin]CAG9573520.1 hypothetical_protein_-_conserved [Leishmania major strain Friedlin]CAJ04680.1 conserved hypothetical protein [Leishmania major strain Friedlin]|eukprot:XP_001683078.1 conserved hypothetical protein [Leishmania major strain Friedlin]